MQNVKTLQTVERERERERERAIVLNKIACINCALIFEKIIKKNKDPCCGFRLLYLRI